MKKFILNLLGIEATAKNIRGKKSSGAEDAAQFKNWRTPGYVVSSGDMYN